MRSLFKGCLLVCLTMLYKMLMLCGVKLEPCDVYKFVFVIKWNGKVSVFLRCFPNGGTGENHKIILFPSACGDRGIRIVPP
jgi:hypothetical protein